jgi:hypothetical protein
MKERALYEDSELRITCAEIRCKEQTIRTASITSVSMESERPWKWLWVRFLPVLLLFVGVFMVTRMFREAMPPFVIPSVAVSGFVEVVLIVVSRLRISSIELQTSGGATTLTDKMDFGDSSSTQARFQVIKDALEQATREAALRSTTVTAQ